MMDILENINKACDELCDSLEQKCLNYLNNGQIPSIVGGDHSVPLGLMRALGKKYEHFGILQIDAHADLRNQYQGFRHSHASIMHNALDIKSINKLTQAGVREWCEEEAQIIDAKDKVLMPGVSIIFAPKSSSNISAKVVVCCPFPE